METPACQSIPIADGLTAPTQSPIQPLHPRRWMGAKAWGLSILGALAPMVVLTMAAPAIAQTGVLGLGDEGTQVSALQGDLQCLGYFTPADGIYGEDTAAKVEQFQRERRLLPDGQVGPATRDALSVARRQRGCQQSAPGSSSGDFPIPMGNLTQVPPPTTFCSNVAVLGTM
jgi:peptidoglycan hydrolase-like protein with peptidoglycan-binding domain